MHDEATREKWRQHNRRRRAAAKKFKICSRCLARERVRGQSQCAECAQKRSG